MKCFPSRDLRREGRRGKLAVHLAVILMESRPIQNSVPRTLPATLVALDTVDQKKSLGCMTNLSDVTRCREAALHLDGKFMWLGCHWNRRCAQTNKVNLAPAPYWSAQEELIYISFCIFLLNKGRYSSSSSIPFDFSHREVHHSPQRALELLSFHLEFVLFLFGLISVWGCRIQGEQERECRCVHCKD